MLVVALDLPDRARALAMAKRLLPHAGMFKVGLELFVAEGPDLVDELRAMGARVFLDLKVHDIPRTAAAAAERAAALGAELLTVHAAGGAEMVKAARDAAPATTRIIAVTMLTSLDDAAAEAIGFREDVRGAAWRLGRLARDAGADGLVCSTHELAGLQGLGGLRIVPGVRPAGAPAGDQKRVATPREALAGGATHVVVGRPIVGAPDPVAAAAAVAAELA